MKFFPREVLLRIKWKMDSMGSCCVEFIDRGTDGDRTTVSGSDIQDISRSYLILFDDTHIPYHRIVRISVEDEEIWVRDQKK